MRWGIPSDANDCEVDKLESFWTRKWLVVVKGGSDDERGERCLHAKAVLCRGLVF